MPSADEVLIAAIGLVLTGAELREAGRLAERASLLSFSAVLPACCECKLIFYMTSRFGCGGGPAVERRSGE
jgi:hypothetical protein